VTMSASKKSKTYHFNVDWEDEFFVTLVRDKCVCLICNANIACMKKGNVERHFRTVHKAYEHDFLAKSELRKRKISELKSRMKVQQSLFTTPLVKSKAGNVASFRVSHVIAKHKKPFEDGEIIKEAFLEAADSLFDSFKNKSEIMASIKDMPLSRNTVTRRMEAMSEDVTVQLQHDLNNCNCFSLQFDESTDAVDTAQLSVFVRMAFEDGSVKEDILIVLPLKETTKGEDVYNVFKTYVTEKSIPIHKLASITTDGAPSMTGIHNGFIALCRKDNTFPPFLSYHCIVHQQALCGKVLNMKHVMSVVVKVVNSIRAKALQRRLFRSLLEEIDCQYGELLLHTEVRWLSRGKVLQRFRDILPHIKEFLQTKNTPCTELDDNAWLMDLAFLTDISEKLNGLNLELQGKGKHVTNMITSVRTFESQIKLLISQIKKNQFKHFPNLLGEINSQKGNSQLAKNDKDKYVVQLELIQTEFQKRFVEFKTIEPIVSYLSYPFGNVDIEDVSQKMCSLFNCDEALVENEVTNLQKDIEIKARSVEPNFWKLVSADKYPNLKKVSLRVLSFFGSTYLCESGFSDMKIIKSKYRTNLTDSHLTDCLRLARTQYVPNYQKLASEMQGQSSH
jgi:Domain of unknown function (DUF4371)/Spin-doc zinc-finger/hAT family C-terminal dimerisation region